MNKLFLAFSRNDYIRSFIYFIKSKIFVTAAVVLSVSGVAVWVNDEIPQTRRDFVTLLFENAESIAITSAGIIFLIDSSDRKKRNHYEAWGVINSAQEQAGNGGRIQALQDLNKDGVDLEGVTVSNADLSGIKLHFGKLRRANFKNTRLERANFYAAYLQGAILSKANLDKAILQEAKLDEASLDDAILDEANLVKASLLMANLRGAHLREANFQNANLEKAILSEASLWNTNLEGANLEEADLRNTSLQGTNFQNANLRGANLKGSRNWTDAELGKAKIICSTTLPEGSKLKPNRDCVSPY